MGFAGGGQTLAEGEIPCLRCSMPQRVSVGLMYVSSLVLLVLSGACGFLVFRDNRCPFLISLVGCFAFVESQSTLSTQAWGSCHVLLVVGDLPRLYVVCFRFRPGVDVARRILFLGKSSLLKRFSLSFCLSRLRSTFPFSPCHSAGGWWMSSRRGGDVHQHWCCTRTRYQGE